MLEIIKTRRSIRRYKSDEVADKDVKDILEAAMFAPSANNEQSWQFVVLSKDKLDAYKQINRNVPRQSPPLGILVCGDKRKQKVKGYFLHACCAATQNMLLASHSKGLGSLWTEVFPDNRPRVKTLLNLPDYIEPVSFVLIGYPDGPEPKQPERYDETAVHWNQW